MVSFTDGEREILPRTCRTFDVLSEHQSDFTIDSHYGRQILLALWEDLNWNTYGVEMWFQMRRGIKTHHTHKTWAPLPRDNVVTAIAKMFPREDWRLRVTPNKGAFWEKPVASYQKWKYLHKTSEGNTWLDHRLTPEVRAMLAAMASRAPLGGVEARYEQIVTDLMKDVTIPDVDESEIQRQAKMRNKDVAPMLDRARLERDERIKAAREAAEDSLCVYPVAPRVQRFFDDYVGSYGHSSIIELVGSPAVYTEQISVMTAWLLFDSPLCAGQEFSTRAVNHKDWPLAREARGDKELESLHVEWMSVFEAELAHWTETFKNPDERARYGLKDKEPFRPALDRARWALPGTIATGCSQTSHLRDRARVIDVATALSTNAPTVRAVIDGIRDTYREAIPGLANLGLKEAVYAEGASVPVHLERMFEVTEQSGDGPVIDFHHQGTDGPTIYLRKKNRSYADYSQNFDRASVTIPCSLAAARDWHRHRTLFPWWMTLETGEDDCFRIDPHYTPMTEYGARKVSTLIRRSQKVFNRLREEQGWVMACMALPLGTRVSLFAQGGVRDVLYMLELRAHAEGANFEYREQAEELLRQFRIGPFGKLFV